MNPRRVSGHLSPQLGYAVSHVVETAFEHLESIFQISGAGLQCRHYISNRVNAGVDSSVQSSDAVRQGLVNRVDAVVEGVADGIHASGQILQVGLHNTKSGIGLGDLRIQIGCDLEQVLVVQAVSLCQTVDTTVGIGNSHVDASNGCTESRSVSTDNSSNSIGEGVFHLLIACNCGRQLLNSHKRIKGLVQIIPQFVQGVFLSLDGVSQALCTCLSLSVQKSLHVRLQIFIVVFARTECSQHSQRNDQKGNDTS